MRVTRRRVLQAASATGGAMIAGCLGGDGDDSGNDDGDGDSDGTDSASGNDTDAAGSGDSPADPDSAAADTPEQEALAFVDDVLAERYEAAYERFAEAYRTQVSAAFIERVHMGLRAAGGSVQDVTVESTGVRSGLQTVQLSIELERATAPVRISTTETPEIAGFVLNGEYERASYVDPDAIETTEHTLEPPGCELGATVARPADVEEAPGVVIVHGSHATDRDATTAANKPYRDIAEGLATEGVATLRYDKRSFACNVPAEEHTVDRVTVDDALHAIEWFRDRDGVRGDDVTVVGHSLGAMMAPEITRRDEEVSGAVGLAAPARQLPAVFIDQIEHLASVGDLELPGVTQQRDQWQRAAEQIESGNYDDDETLMGLPGAFWRSLEGYDPVGTAEDVDVPQFYVQGERDYQVTMADDFAQWQSAFENDDAVALSSYERLDHAFLPGEGPSVPQAYGVPNEVGESVVADVAAWIRDD